MTVVAIRRERGVAACPRATVAHAVKMMSATIIFAFNFKGTPSVMNFALSEIDQFVKRICAQFRLVKPQNR
jgi:hypothetical protein